MSELVQITQKDTSETNWKLIRALYLLQFVEDVHAVEENPGQIKIIVADGMSEKLIEIFELFASVTVLTEK